MKIGDYVKPISNDEEFLKSLAFLGIKYEDLTGVIVDVVSVPNLNLNEENKEVVSIKSINSFKLTENLKADNFEVIDLPLDMQSNYEYIMSGHNKVFNTRL